MINDLEILLFISLHIIIALNLWCTFKYCIFIEKYITTFVELYRSNTLNTQVINAGSNNDTNPLNESSRGFKLCYGKNDKIIFVFSTLKKNIITLYDDSEILYQIGDSEIKFTKNFNNWSIKILSKTRLSISNSDVTIKLNTNKHGRFVENEIGTVDDGIYDECLKIKSIIYNFKV